MELFDQIYGCYYQIVGQILTEAYGNDISKSRIQQIIARYGYLESALTILPRLTDDTWPLLTETSPGQYRSRLRHPVPSHFTTLQKTWVKALLQDPRIRLFFDRQQLAQLQEELQDTEPLYRLQDFHYFDRYLDGDPYTKDLYQIHFRQFFKAVRQRQALSVIYRGKFRTEPPSAILVLPCFLQYSSKDDKFRADCIRLPQYGTGLPVTLNLSRVLDCRPAYLTEEELPPPSAWQALVRQRRAAEPVRIRIYKEPNALERCMLHFASYEKQTSYDREHDAYLCSIFYDKEDETELLIQILSFGPVIRVLGPESFLALVRERVRRQHELFYGPV